MSVEDDHNDCGHDGHHQEDFTNIQCPVLFCDIVQDNVWQRWLIWQKLMGHCQTAGAGNPTHTQEYQTEYGFQWFTRDFLGGDFIESILHGYGNILITSVPIPIILRWHRTFSSFQRESFPMTISDLCCILVVEHVIQSAIYRKYKFPEKSYRIFPS